MVSLASFKRVWIILILIVLSLLLLVIMQDRKKVDLEKTNAIHEYRLKELSIENSKLRIEDLKQKRIQDSLKVIITKLSYEKQKVKIKYIEKRDSIVTLPIDQSIEFFSRNLPQKGSNRR